MNDSSNEFFIPTNAVLRVHLKSNVFHQFVNHIVFGLLEWLLKRIVLSDVLNFDTIMTFSDLDSHVHVATCDE